MKLLHRLILLPSFKSRAACLPSADECLLEAPPLRKTAPVVALSAEEAKRRYREQLKSLARGVARRRNVDVPASTDRQVEEVEDELGVRLPKDYAWISTTLGSIQWPVEVLDATLVKKLTGEMKRRFPKEWRAAVAIGRSVNSAGGETGYLALTRDGQPMLVGGPEIEEKTLIEYLSREISGRPTVLTAQAMISSLEKRFKAAPAVAIKELLPVSAAPEPIRQDPRLRSVLEAVRQAKNFITSTGEDGRVQVRIDDFKGGTRRMFLDQDAWAAVQASLEAEAA